MRALGPCDGLAGERGAPGWGLREAAGRALLTGARPDGVILWRMTGAAPFEDLAFEWHPTAFEEWGGDFRVAVTLALVLRLIHMRGFVMHGSAQVMGGEGIICTGPSGKGKSTISRLFDRRGVEVLTDERPILRQTEGAGVRRFRVYGSPWPSSGGFAGNGSAPLRKVYFLERGPEPRVEPVTRREAVHRLLSVSLVPWLDEAFFDPVIRTLESLLDEVPCAVLRFRPDETVVDAVRRDLGC